MPATSQKEPALWCTPKPLEIFMVRCRRSVLPKDHIKKYTNNSVTQEQRLRHKQYLVEKGRREAEAAAAEAAAAERMRWQEFNDRNLADAVRQKDAAQWQAAIDKSAYEEVYSTARESMDKAGKFLSITTVEGTKVLRQAGEEADNLLASKNLFSNERLKDLRDLSSFIH